MPILNKISCGVFIAVAIMLSGCATIMSGTTQNVNVQAIDYNTHQLIPNAQCTLTDAKGITYPVYSNPGVVSIDRAYGGLRTNCVAKGYQQKAVGSGQSFNAWTLVNVLFWPGAIVDAATGATMKYPSHITVLMQRQ